MKTTRLVLFTLLVSSSTVYAQQTVFRCGNEYTNDANDAKARGCKVVGGGNLTVIPSLAPPSTPSGSKVSNAPAPSSPSSSPKVDSSEQRARDADAKGVLEAELRKAEQRRDQLRQEFNNGQPEKLAPETKNHQKYLDRVAEMRNQITRTDNDIASLRRELARLTGKSPS